jgi:hypothetical protein
LYISFPIATEANVIFNKHRIFSPYDIFLWPSPGCMLKLVRFDYVDDAGDLHQNVNLNTENIIAKYGCGIYTFEKLIGQVDFTPEAISAAIPKPQFSFFMDPNNQEGAGSFYQRPFLASMMAESLGAQFVMASNPHSDCHYHQEDRLIIEQDWEKIFSFMGAPTHFTDPLQQLNPDNQLVAGETYHVPFELSYQYLARLQPDQLQKILESARNQFRENIQRYPELLPKKYQAIDGDVSSGETIIALHLRDSSKGDSPFSPKTLLDWQMFSRDYGLPDNNPDYYSKLYAHAVNQIV